MRVVERLAWWLILAIGLGVVLLTSYQAISTRRFEAANGVAGELLAGGSIGQTFVARYDGLSGVELQIGTYLQGPGPAKASLVLHLRENPPSVPLTSTGQVGTSNSLGVQPGDSQDRDLATVHLTAGTQLAQNPWYLFSFPAISDSQDRSFYVEIESPDGAPGHALTVFWWEPNADNPQGDPFAYGAAYLNGQAQKGDLAFGLHYQPSPVSAALQVARAMSANLSGEGMVLLFGGAAVGGIAILYVVGSLREPERRRRWLRRWSLPVGLGAALLSGLVYIFAVPAWQGPDEHAHFVYAAMLDHYGLDYAKVNDIVLHDRTPDKMLVDSVNASMTRHDFTRLLSDQSAPGSPTDISATFFSAMGKPPAYYWLGAVAMRTARVLGIAADPYTNPDIALLVLRCVSLVLGMVVVGLAWLAARLISANDDSWLILLLPLTVALLPMHTFDITIFDNDVLAEVAVSVVFVLLAALLRRPTGWRAAVLAGAAILATVGGLFTKPTAQAAVPLLAGGLLVWVGLLVTKALDRRMKVQATERQSSVGSRRRITVPIVLVGVVALLAVVCVVVAYEPLNQAQGWVTSRRPLRPIARTETTTAHDGRFVLELGPKGHQAVTMFQVLMLPVYHPEVRVGVSGWVRVAPGAGKALTGSPTASMRIEAGGILVGEAEVPLGSADVWQPISATADIAEGTQQIVLRVTSAGQRAQFDDFTLKMPQEPVGWHDSVFRPMLINRSAESGYVGLRPEIARLLPASLVTVANVVANPQPFDKPALWGQYADGQYTSFWGNFGWLSIPLPDGLYLVLGIVSVVAVAGLGARVVRDWRGSARGEWSTSDWLGLVAAFSVVATVTAIYAWQMTQLATRSSTAGLSGRYLFVLIIPIAWLLLAGLESVGSLLGLPALRRRFEAQDAAVALHTRWAARAVWVYVACLMLFAAYCLLALIIPYYYA